MKIYVAGASREVRAITAYMAELRQAGHEITFDWTKEVIAAQRAALVEPAAPKAGLSSAKRLECALLDAEGVLTADILWVVVPQENSYSVGCWTELGIAIGASGCGRTKRVVVSGDWERSAHTEFIFTELADARFGSHERALSYLCQLKSASGSDTQAKKEG